MSSRQLYSRPDSARTVDVFVTNDELEDGRKAKQTACLKVDPGLLKPAPCVSKQGISTGAMFTEPEPPRTGRNLTDGEMGMLYDKFVGPASLGNTAVRMELHERGLTPRSAPSGPDPRNGGMVDSGDRGAPSPSPGMAVAMAAAGSAVRAAALDEQFAEQAAAAAKMKYVAPHIAKKYGIKQHIRPASASASPYAASSVSAGTAAAARGAGAAPRPTTAGVSRPGTADADAGAGPGSPSGTAGGAGGGSGSGGVANAHLPYGGKPPRPQSAAFVAVSRSKAQATGSKFVYGGNPDVPNPGKYFPRYGAMDKAQPVRDWSKMYGGPYGSAAAAAARARRPGSAPPGGQRSEMTTGGAAAAEASGYPTAQASTAGGGGGAPKRSMSLSSSAAAAQQQQQQQQQTAAELARAQTAARHEELFAGAHHVHERAPPPTPGTTSFKAPGRKPPETTTTAGHLYGEYFRDGYDALTRRSSRPSSAFQRQVPRPPPTALAPHGDTGPALGPGVYCAEKPLPATHTGRHVTAGHSSLAQTRDWSRSGARPVSAPHARPPPAAAYHQGYWGPDGPPAALFPDAPEYDQLVALRALQERVQQREDALHPRRAASARQHPDQATATATATTSPPIQPPQYAIADAYPGVDGRPLAYVGPERYGQYSSTGLARRVQGGAFSKSTRAIAAHGMRVMADGKVTPPANVAVRMANDLTYDYDVAVEGHRGRPPAWQLPPNRNALSQRWVSTAATAYLNT